MILLDNVSKSYHNENNNKTEILKEISVHIQPGEIFGLIGRSGAGKSTLLRLLNGLEPPCCGSIIVHHQEMNRLSQQKRRFLQGKIGNIFQDPCLLWSRTVKENIQLPLEILGYSKKEQDNRIEILLDQVNLTDRSDAYPAQLSGGEKQRVGIARALVKNPDILLCDEPTSALDSDTTSVILDLIKKIHSETGITILFVTHELNIVQNLCRRVAIMEKGRIVEIDQVERIFKQPQHPASKRLLAM